MKAWLLKQAARVDALSLRERLFLFFSVVVVVLAVADVLWFTPTQNLYKQAKLKVSAQDQELVRLRAEVRVNAAPVDVNKSTRETLAELEAQVKDVNTQIATLAPSTPGGPELEQVLVQFLRRQEGLTLLSAGTAADGSGAALPSGMTRKGVQLSVSGPYPALVAYVQTLETALPLLRWGTMQLKAVKDKPPELTLQVYVLGVQP